MIFHIFTCILHHLWEYYKLKMWPLPVGLIAQLVEHRIGIAEVVGLNPVQAPFFLAGFNFTTTYQVVCIAGMIINVFIYFSSVQIYDLSYIHVHETFWLLFYFCDPCRCCSIKVRD